ncbi:MAG: hypothetical protein ACO1OQ_08380 [Rufibacter sp.]
MRPFLLSSMLALAAVSVCFPVEAQTTGAEKKPDHQSIHIMEGTYVRNDEKGQIFIVNTTKDGVRTQLVTEGKITIAEDEKSISAIADGGKFEFSRQEKGSPEHMVVLKNKNGQLEGKYWVEDEPQDYATAGKAWLAQYLPELISTTGLGAEACAERLYKEGGAANVLNFTGTMASGTGRTKMYRYLLTKPDLKAADLQNMLEQVGQQKGSDYEAASLLLNVPKVQLQNSGVATAYVGATNNIASDYEKGRVLRHLLGQEKLSETTLNQVVQSIGSMSSDYETRRVLEVLAARPSLTDKQFGFALQAFQKISSDYERAKGLHAFMKYEQQVVKQFDHLLPVMKSIASDYEKARAYRSLLSNTKLGTNQYVSLLKATEGIGSDYEKARVLKTMAPKLPKEDKKVREAYEAAARTVDSKYEYDKVIAAIN